MIQAILASTDRLLDRIRGHSGDRPNLQRTDAVLAVAWAVVAFAASLLLGRLLGDVLYTPGSLNIWFQADNPRVVTNLLDAHSDQYRTTVHPIFAILFTPWVSALPALGLEPFMVAKLVIAACAGTSAGLLFASFRLIGLSRLAASAFAGVFVASAAFAHWYSVIEVAPFNGLSVCVALFALAYGPSRSRLLWVLASAFSLSITITNWMAGLAATIARWQVRTAIAISAGALALVLALSLVQTAVYPSAKLFFNPRALAAEREYAGGNLHDWSPATNLQVLTIYSQVVPAPVAEDQAQFRVVNNQWQAPQSAGWPGVVAMAAWAVLLALGLWGCVGSRWGPHAFGLLLMLAGQLALGAVYGDVSFLYATNILPMLVTLAALSWLTPLRYVGLALAVLVIAAGGFSNLTQFRAGARLADEIIAGGGNPVWDRFDGAVLAPLPLPLSRRASP